MRLLLLAAASLLASVSVSAQQVYFSAGTSLTTQGGMDLELRSTNAGPIYGVSSSSDYYSALTERPWALSTAFRVQYPTAEMRFTYDAASAPDPRSTDSSARYYTGTGVARLADMQGAQTTLQVGNPLIVVSDMPSGRSFSMGGALAPAGTFSYHDETPQLLKIDLRSLVASSHQANPGSGFDLSAFSSLPIHLTGPSEYHAQSMYVGMYAFAANPPQASNLGLPTSLNLGSYVDATYSILFEGDFTLSLDAVDFATTEAFSAAQTWLAANPMRLYVRSNIVFKVDTLNQQDGGWGGPLGLGADWYVPSAVPEPASAMMWIGSLIFGAGLLRSRRRKAAAH